MDSRTWMRGLLAGRGTRRAVMDFWANWTTSLSLRCEKRGWASVGRHHPMLRVTNRNGSQMLGAVVFRPSFLEYGNHPPDGDARFGGPIRKRSLQLLTHTLRAGLGGQDLERGWPGECAEGGGVGLWGALGG